MLCIVRRDDNAIRDAEATSHYVICALFALHLSIVNENQTFADAFQIDIDNRMKKNFCCLRLYSDVRLININVAKILLRDVCLVRS